MTSSVVNGWGEVLGDAFGEVLGDGAGDPHEASRGCSGCFGDLGDGFGGPFGEESGEGSRPDGAVIGPPPP
jgi:hypothetical protein